MTHEQFEQALDRYGGDLGRWPAAMRAEAKALADKDAAAARMLAEAARLDALLSEVVGPTSVDSAAIGAIIAGIRGDRHREITVRPTRRLAAWSGAAMAAFLALGFVLGLAIPQTQDDAALAGLAFGTSTTTTFDTIDTSGGLL
jgi:hypothetical protein